MRPLRIAGRQYRAPRSRWQESVRFVFVRGEACRSAVDAVGIAKRFPRTCGRASWARPSAASGPSASTASDSVLIGNSPGAGAEATLQDAPGSTIGTAGICQDPLISDFGCFMLERQPARLEPRAELAGGGGSSCPGAGRCRRGRGSDRGSRWPQGHRRGIGPSLPWADWSL